MKTTQFLLATLLAVSFTPATADDAATGTGTERRIVTRTDGGSHGGPIKNAPYHAEVISERLQLLGDGNQIVNRTTAMTWRDSAGRTRTETRDARGDVSTVVIHDPVGRVHWVLDPRRKSAMRVAVELDAARNAARAAAERVAAERGRARVDTLRKEGKLPEGARIVVHDARQSDPQEIRVRVAQPGGAPFMMASEMASAVGMVVNGVVGDQKWAADEVTRELGTREFSGLKAEGRQRSYEIPADAIGNREPITVSSESWTSPEFKILVYFKRSDPRTGDTIYRLDDFKRGEPDAALFTAPQDYTVIDPMRMGTTTIVTPD